MQVGVDGRQPLQLRPYQLTAPAIIAPLGQRCQQARGDLRVDEGIVFLVQQIAPVDGDREGLVGVTGLELSRADFFEKELTFQVSCSYGPGRYDPLYEEMGQDYPFGFVRWTEQRNFEAVLDMLAGRYPSDAFAELRPRIVWDRVEGTLEARDNARMLAVTNPGTIPTHYRAYRIIQSY